MNTFGTKFKITIFGESHSEKTGVVIDGVPAGILLSEEDFKTDLERRKGGKHGTTTRVEEDLPLFVSGLSEGRTDGVPLVILFKNDNVRTQDYDKIKNIPRPGHADYPAFIKYGGFNSRSGGGGFSGRLTLPVVAAGVVAKKILKVFCPEVEISAYIIRIGGEEADSPEAKSKLDYACLAGDSIGGEVECVVKNLPVGLGNPFFDSTESLLSHAVFSIPGVRGIEFGDGFASSSMNGSVHNDPISKDSSGNIIITKNGAGGINGGLTNGNEVKFRVAFKPTSSIKISQKSVNLNTYENTGIQVPGRHDVCFALRTPVIVEALTATVFADFILTK